MRQTTIPIVTFLGLVAWLAALDCPVQAQAPAAVTKPGRVETVELADGLKSIGQLVADPTSGVAFLRSGETVPIPLERVRSIKIEGPESDAPLGIPPFQVHLGNGNRISGKLLRLEGDKVRLDSGQGRLPWAVARSGITTIQQRPGEVQVLREGFETIDAGRWSQTGRPVVNADRHLVGDRALTLPAGGSSVTTRIPTPFGSGRVDLAYWDSATRAAGQRWFVDLTFRKGNSDLSTMRIVPGWTEEILAVETPGGPPLPVQPLSRKEGWHRLIVQFDDERVAVTLDGNDLAHGRGVGGPLIEIRLASETVGAAQPPEGLIAVIDDLRVVRLVEPSGRFEVDPSQDEVRLVSGDQLFGKLGACDADSVRLTLDGREIRLGWNDVAGLYPRRSSGSSSPIAGVWVDVEWRTVAGGDPRDLDRVEAVLAGVEETSVILDIPHVGRVSIPRDAIRQITVQGRSTRVLVDVHSHHLGDRTTPDLDPPQPEKAPFEISFILDKVPVGASSILLDVLKVIGEEGNREFSAIVKKGELRTSVSLNGKKLDDLNRHVSTSNESPVRVRIAMPVGLLKVGDNRLKLEQTGTLADPLLRDNLGVLRIAIDFASESPARP